MKSIAEYITETIHRDPIRYDAILDWRDKYKGGKYWTAYLKEHPRTITNILAAMAGKDINHWDGRKGAIVDFINMFFCGYLGRSQEPLAKVKNISFSREDGICTCSCIAYDKWNGGALAKFLFTLEFNDASELKAFRANKFDKITKRKLTIKCETAKYKKNGEYIWKKVGSPIIKIDVPPINDANRGQFHETVIKQMLDGAHYMDWNKPELQNLEEY